MCFGAAEMRTSGGVHDLLRGVNNQGGLLCLWGWRDVLTGAGATDTNGARFLCEMVVFVVEAGDIARLVEFTSKSKEVDLEDKRWATLVSQREEVRCLGSFWACDVCFVCSVGLGW